MSVILSLVLLLSSGLEGTIVDEFTGQGVPYVQLKVEGLDTTVLTDSCGKFAIGERNLPSYVVIKAVRIGYQPKVLKWVSTAKPVLIMLQPRAIPISGVTSTATRLKLNADPAMPVSVIESRGIGIEGKSDISELLARSPAVLVQDYNNLSTVSLRGATVEQTLVLFDGVRLNTSLNNQTDFSLISPSLVSRVEIARGGASALYGANPIGGVLNIISPEPKKKEVRASFGLGSFGKKYAGFRLANPGTVNFLFGGGYLHNRNNFPYQDQNDSARIMTNADLTRGDLILKAGTGLGKDYLSFASSLCLTERGSPGPISFPSDRARLQDGRLLLISGYDRTQDEIGRLSARIYHQRLYQHYFNPGEYFTADDTHRINVSGLNLVERLNLLTVPAKIQLAAGLEGITEHCRSTAVGTPARITGAGFIEANITWAGFTLNPATRYELLQTREQERVATYGAFSPRINLFINQPQPLSFYLGVNNSYRTPTFNELYWPDDGWTRGNPNLMPEWAEGISAGLGVNLAPTSLFRIGVFYNRVKDLIQWQPDENYVYRPVNIARAKITGIELEPQFDYKWFGVQGALTFQRCRSDSSYLPYRPELFGKGELWLAYNRQQENWVRLSLGINGTTKKFTNPPNSDTLPGYLVFDLGSTVRLPVKFVNAQINSGCRNIFDRCYQLIKDYPLPGRSFYLEAEIEI